MTSISLLRIEHPEPWLRQLIFNRPDKGNALNTALIQQIQQGLEDAETDTGIKAILLSGAGKHFCTGADIQAVQTGHFQAEAFANLLWTIWHLSKPTLAFAQGAVMGGGVGLIACVDLAFAHKDTLFGLPEVRLGWVPAMISPYLVETIGYRRSKAWALQSQRISARTAQAWGLIEGYQEDYHTCLAQLSTHPDTALKAIKAHWKNFESDFLKDPQLIQMTAQSFTKEGNR